MPLGSIRCTLERAVERRGLAAQILPDLETAGRSVTTGASRTSTKPTAFASTSPVRAGVTFVAVSREADVGVDRRAARRAGLRSLPAHALVTRARSRSTGSRRRGERRRFSRTGFARRPILKAAGVGLGLEPHRIGVSAPGESAAVRARPRHASGRRTRGRSSTSTYPAAPQRRHPPARPTVRLIEVNGAAYDQPRDRGGRVRHGRRHRRHRAGVGRGAGEARRRLGRPLLARRAAGDDGHELGRVVAVPARRGRPPAGPGGDQRRGRAPDARSLSASTCHSSTGPLPPSASSRGRSRSRSPRHPTGP